MQICVPHPNYPTTRVALRLQSVGFQFSPARYHRIMQVVEVFSGGPDEDAAQSAFRPWDSPDFDGQMSVLSWKVRTPIANYLISSFLHRLCEYP
jgi:vacuolar protein sorting-associated protein 13A/C